MISIVNLLMIIFIAVLISHIADRDVENVLPAAVLSFLLMLYGIAIIGKAHHSYEASLIVFAGIWIFYIVRKRRLLPGWEDIKKRVFTPGFILYVLTVALMYVAYGNHFITVWDDFHYNATFPKDMFFYGAMPTGSHSATLYRSYPPLMQLFFYWGFQGVRAFSEPLMFRYKMFLIYTLMLPVFKQINNSRGLLEKVSCTVFALCMPYLFMFELIESLSMDTFMALLFGYAVYYIIFVYGKTFFSYLQITLSLACLTLVKQIAPVFTAIALAVWAISIAVRFLRAKKGDGKELRSGLPAWFAASFVSVCSYLSWKIFCNIKGNSVYLSGKLTESMNPTGLNFPDYALGTCREFIKSIFIFHLDLARNGLTLFATLIIFAAIMICLKMRGRLDSGTYPGLAVLCMGLIGYLAVLLYTYIFVFEEWEAESLSSIDRYFGTYALTVMYITVMAIFGHDACDDREDGKAGVYRPEIPILAAVFLICFPWKNVCTNLIPDLYLNAHKQEWQDTLKVRNEIAAVSPETLEVRTVMVVTNEGNTVYSRGMLYDLIPLIPAEYIIEYVDPGHADALLEKCRDESAYYVYFSDELIKDRKKTDCIRAAVDPGVQLKSGVMYRYDTDRNLIY